MNAVPWYLYATWGQLPFDIGGAQFVELLEHRFFMAPPHCILTVPFPA